MLRAFVGNQDKGLRRAAERSKLRFLNTSVLSIARYRFSRWPFQRTYASNLDRLQRKLLAITFDIRPRSEEPWDSFTLRRRAETHALATRTGRWSQAWARSQISWDAHIRRGHDKQAWTPQILGFRDSAWLSLQRIFASHGTESRLGTRVVQGRPKPRWQIHWRKRRPRSRQRNAPEKTVLR